MIFFSSDLHIGHENIIKYCNRPYKNVAEMNEAIVSNWNKKVSNSDLVYMLGDICMGNLNDSIYQLSRMNGKMILIRGNHDKQACKRADFMKQFHSTHDYLELKDGGDTFIMSHFPFAIWNKSHRGSMALCGHSHGSYLPSHPKTKDAGKILDVGMDCHNCQPISIDEVRAIMATKTFNQVDHHGDL